MLTYLIKSALCMLLFYAFFHFWLRDYKILLFNRYYLISSVIVSMIVPLIEIPIGSGYSLTSSFYELPVVPSISPEIQSNPEISDVSFSNRNFVPVIFIIVSAILLIRFAFNFTMIIRKVFKYEKIRRKHSSLILLGEKTLPYSFFKYVFINKRDYEDGKIDNELIIHEEAHCSQYHSADIIFFELLIVFLWFNPVIWLFRKEILLNHEYYADSQVLKSSNTSVYLKLLTDLVIQNNTSNLASNIKYSAIKKRVIMMTKEAPPKNAIARKIVIVPIVLMLTIPFTFSQNSDQQNKMDDFSGKWVLNNAKSNSLTAELMSSTIIIRQSGNSVNLDISYIPKEGIPVNRTEKYVFNLSMQSAPNANGKSTRIECIAPKDGKSFTVTTTESSLQDGVKKELIRTLKYTLDNHGNSLVINQHDSISEGSKPARSSNEIMVYDKVN